MQVLLPLLLCSALVSLQNVRADWPDFRGPWQSGDASAPGDTNLIGLPLRWSETENVKWKTPIPRKGWSSPVISGRQIWITTATEDGHDFFAICVDADTGKIIFSERLFHCDSPEPLGNNLNSYASPSPVIEPGRVYVHFGSYGTACLDTKSFKVIWKRDDLPCRHYRGPGSSPVLFEDLLILSMDGIDVQYMAALKKQTGKTVWKTDRTASWDDLEADGKPRGGGDYRKAYYTPLIVQVKGQPRLLTSGSKAAYCYDPRNGRELWKINHGGFSGASRPLFHQGHAIFCTGNGKGEIMAVKMGGQGDVTDTNIIWRNGRGFPRMPSPVAINDLIFMVSDNGIASCLDGATGKQNWQERLGGDFAASLLFADHRVYCFGQNGKTTVLRPSRKFEVLATNQLEDGFLASPAVDGKALILRTKKSLYRIEAQRDAVTP